MTHNPYYRQGIEDLDLYIERATPRCPDKRYYYIFDGVKAICSERHPKGRPFHTLRAAQDVYGDLVRKRSQNPPYQHVRHLKRKAEQAEAAERAKLISRESQEEFLDRTATYWDESGKHK